MPVDFPLLVYSPCFDIFARVVMFHPLVSQPGRPSFVARGIFDTNDTDVAALDGSIITDSRTELDIFMPEWPIFPLQGDRVDIPKQAQIEGGLFEVADVMGHGNAGGELTLRLERVVASLVPAYVVTADPYSLGPPEFDA
jgi:hypothetical protein